ncbi:MAG TPA: hypothetical protein VKA55_11205 [Gammaproteobacteria bacterium]|nr:hypothetical protein [Gammaproteobacteria bacterium]
MTNKLSIAISLFGLALAANTAMAGSTGDGSHGSAVRHNTEVQTLNPEAGSKEPEATTLDGPKAENVIEDYRSKQQKAETEGLIEGMGSE